MSRRRTVIVLVALIVTALTGASLGGHTSWDGAVLIALTDRHGLHQGDLPVLVAWLIGVTACGWLWRDS